MNIVPQFQATKYTKRPKSWLVGLSVYSLKLTAIWNQTFFSSIEIPHVIPSHLKYKQDTLEVEFTQTIPEEKLSMSEVFTSRKWTPCRVALHLSNSSFFFTLCHHRLKATCVGIKCFFLSCLTVCFQGNVLLGAGPFAVELLSLSELWVFLDRHIHRANKVIRSNYMGTEIQRELKNLSKTSKLGLRVYINGWVFGID